MRFLNHTQRRTRVGRIPLDEWSTIRRDLYLTTRNTHNRQTSMPAVGFEPTISAGERSHALDGAFTGTGMLMYVSSILYGLVKLSPTSFKHFLNTALLPVTSKSTTQERLYLSLRSSSVGTWRCHHTQSALCSGVQTKVTFCKSVSTK